MFNIKFPAPSDLKTLDDVFVGAAHHYWMSLLVVGTGEDKGFHLAKCEMHCSILTAIICTRGYFGDAKDFEGLKRDTCELWKSKDSPIATRDIFCNMLPDSRFWIGEHHPNDEILSRIEFFVEQLNVG